MNPSLTYLDLIFGIITGGIGMKIIDFILNRFRTKEQKISDLSLAKKKELSVAEQAMQIVTIYGEKIDTLTKRVNELEQENRILMDKVERLTMENEVLKDKINKMQKSNK